MQAQYLSPRTSFEVFIPPDWSWFGLSLLLGIPCLLVSAVLAKVRIGSLPVNLIYWHLWVLANAKVAPSYNDDPPRVYRPYVFFWAASICFLFWSFLVLVAIVFTTLQP